MTTDQQANDASSPDQRSHSLHGTAEWTSRAHDQVHIHYPPSWYYFGSVKEFARGPVIKSLLGKRLVGFLTESGHPGVLESRCVHMGSDLGGGCVVGESLQCSLHHWQFDPQGNCRRIPATDSIPPFARQVSYPAVVRHGNIYFFNGSHPLFPLPFFSGLEHSELTAARPFIEHLECPWYMIGANAVDVQHFAIAHNRRMLQEPKVDHPHPHVHRTVCHFEVGGNALSDRITRRFGGPKVQLEVIDWSSTMIFVRSSLAKTETFGMLSVVPLGPERTLGHVTVMARTSDGLPGRQLFDPLRAFVRRTLIRTFLRSDVNRLTGTRYSPNTYIEIDDQFSQYLEWLRGLSGHTAGK